jgi:hypothetical protein
VSKLLQGLESLLEDNGFLGNGTSSGKLILFELIEEFLAFFLVLVGEE